MNQLQGTILQILHWHTQATKYCEIKDLGDKLQVKLGPSLGIWMRLGFERIPYDQIKSFEDPKGCCEACCGLCVGVNPCGCYGGLRGLGMRSGNCKQRQIILTLKQAYIVEYNGKHKYKRISITVDAKDYDALIQLLNEKCGNNDGENSQITIIWPCIFCEWI